MWKNSVVKGRGRFWCLSVVVLWRKLCLSLSIDRDETWGNYLSSPKVSLSYFLSCHCMAHTNLFFTLPEKEQMSWRFKEITVMWYTLPWLSCRKYHVCLGPSNDVKLKYAIWNFLAPMRSSFLVCFTIWTSLLLGHILQSERLFLHCGARYCMRCFIAGTWICSHSGGTCLVPPFAHVWMTWGPGHFMENMPCAVETVTWRPGSSFFLSCGVPLAWSH